MPPSLWRFSSEHTEDIKTDFERWEPYSYFNGEFSILSSWSRD